MTSRKLTIPEIRHCMLALASQLEDGPLDNAPGFAEIAAILRHLANETRRAPRRRGGERTQAEGRIEGEDEPPREAAE